MKRWWAILLLPCLLVEVVIAQSPPTEAAFDVVSLKRNTSGARSASFGAVPGVAFSMTNVPAIALVTYAYGVADEEVVGAPEWLTADRYDMTAKAEGKPGDEQVKAMIRTLLKERMKLTTHVTPQEKPVYALVVARPSHPGLKKSTLDCDAIRAAREAAAKSGAPEEPYVQGVAPKCGYSWSNAIYSGGMTMDTLADILRGLAGRKVLNRTQLDGRYEFTLRAAFAGSTSASPDDPPTIFTALQEQLGLRLDSQRAPLDTLVIDHIERPDEN